VSLGTKTTALLAAIVTVVFAVAAAGSLHFQEESLKDSIFKGLDGEARTVASGISAFIEGSLREAQAVAATLPPGGPTRLREVEAHLELMSRSFPKFENGIFVLDAHGTFLADYPSHPELRGESFAFRDYYLKAIREKRAIVDPYFTTKLNGSGLGLTSSHSIVRRHEGHVAVDSEPGRGTIFSVFIPASQAAGVQQPPRQDVLPRGKGRVLLMDDEEPVRKVGARMLQHLGYEVELAMDGDEALRTYAAERERGRRFDAVIMDLTVPGGMGGKEAMQKLAALDAGARGIVSSGYSTDPVMASYRAHGFCCVVAKPYRVEELGSALAEAITTPPRAG
jgi:CheY-like chemotaxis protein